MMYAESPKIYTSYFAKLKSLPEDIAPISICGKAPDWYTGLQFKTLAPKFEFFMKYKADHDADYYSRCFKEQVLDKLTCSEIVERLFAMSGGKDICLLCYEKLSDFCHRHLVAEWFMRNGVACAEYAFQKKDRGNIPALS